MQAQAASFVAGELPVAERGAFEQHLAQCATCRREVEATRRLVERLQAEPTAQVSHDLAQGLLERIAEQSVPRRSVGWNWPVLGRVAALLVLALGGLVAYRYWARGPSGDAVLSQQGPVSPAVQAVSWLCRTQEPDGSWSTERWGGSRRYEVALTALSLLSLSDDAGAAVPGRRLAVGRAVRYLCGLQDVQGGFGDAFDGSPYNQGMATLALLRAYRGHPDASLKPVLDRAIAGIVTRQLRDGGWGYAGMETPSSNLSITLWQVEALRLAVTLGWAEARTPAARGLRWIAAVASDDGSFGYRQSGDFPEGSRTLTAMGAMSLLDVAEGNLVPAARRAAIKARVRRLAAATQPDLDYYGRYFLSAALKCMNEDAARQQLADLRTALAAIQVRQGPECGSWKADDRWSTAGGRVYATAMASLSLE
jgi:prenyltransferase beta subunit